MTLLTIDEAARLLRVTKQTLYRLGDVPRVRMGHRWMFLKEDLKQRSIEFSAFSEGQNRSDATRQKFSKNLPGLGGLLDRERRLVGSQ